MSEFIDQRLAEAAQKASERARAAESAVLQVSKRYRRFREKHRAFAQQLHRECFVGLMKALHLPPPGVVPHVWPPPAPALRPLLFVADRFVNLEIE